MTNLIDTLRRLELDHDRGARVVQWNGGPLAEALDDPELEYHIEASAACYVKRLELTR